LRSVGEAATYQSYQAWVTFMAGVGSAVIFVHAVPARRHKCGPDAAAPNT
jgi:hypothetical protein